MKRYIAANALLVPIGTVEATSLDQAYEKARNFDNMTTTVWPATAADDKALRIQQATVWEIKTNPVSKPIDREASSD